MERYTSADLPHLAGDGRFDIVKYFFTHGGEVIDDLKSKKCFDSMTHLDELVAMILIVSSSKNQWDIFDYVQSLYPHVDKNIDMSGFHGSLRRAINDRCAKQISILMDRGFDPNALVYGRRNSALWYAKDIGASECCKVLEIHGAKIIENNYPPK